MRFGQDTVVAEVIDPKTGVSVSSGKFIGRTCLYLLIGLATTFLVMLGIGLVLSLAFHLDPVGIEAIQHTETMTDAQMTALAVYGIMLIASAITMIAIMLWINIGMIAQGKVSMVAYIIYAVTMGVFLSSFTLILPFYDILLAIGITTLTFGAMALVGFLGGDKIKWFGVIGFGLLIGVALIGIFNLVFFLLFPTLYDIYILIASIVGVIAMLLITAFDFWRMKKIASQGTQSNDLALFCAFNLYVDYIYILIRVLALLARNRR